MLQQHRWLSVVSIATIATISCSACLNCVQPQHTAIFFSGEVRLAQCKCVRGGNAQIMRYFSLVDACMWSQWIRVHHSLYSYTTSCTFFCDPKCRIFTQQELNHGCFAWTSAYLLFGDWTLVEVLCVPSHTTIYWLIKAQHISTVGVLKQAFSQSV